MEGEVRELGRQRLLKFNLCYRQARSEAVETLESWKLDVFIKPGNLFKNLKVQSPRIPPL